MHASDEREIKKIAENDEKAIAQQSTKQKRIAEKRKKRAHHRKEQATKIANLKAIDAEKAKEQAKENDTQDIGVSKPKKAKDQKSLPVLDEERESD